MVKVLVDTDILIDYSKGYIDLLESYLEKQENKKLTLFINPIVVSEFFTNDKLKTKSKLKKAERFIRLFSIIPINKKTGIIAGKLLREKEVGFIGDAFIAANCLEANLKLATRNKRHFSKVKNLKLYRL